MSAIERLMDQTLTLLGPHGLTEVRWVSYEDSFDLIWHSGYVSREKIPPEITARWCLGVLAEREEKDPERVERNRILTDLDARQEPHLVLLEER